MTNTTAPKMIVRDRHHRGVTQISWLDSHHSFSFGNYYDPDYMGFRSLRVINDDKVAPGGGFATHGHKDSLGTGSVIRPGEAQIMSAGTGIMHSEFNHSPTEPVHLLQIWMLPEMKGLAPRYEQKAFTLAEREGKLRLIAAKDGRDGAVKIYQDVDLYTSILRQGDVVEFDVSVNRYGWLQVAQGTVNVNGIELHGGDGLEIHGAEHLEIVSQDRGEILLFDLG